MFLPRCRSRRIPVRSAALKEIYNAEDIDKAQVAIKAFEIDYGAKYPKAVAKIVDRRRRAPGVLQVPGRALDPPENHKPDRKHFRHRAFDGPRSPKAPDHARPELPWPTS